MSEMRDAFERQRSRFLDAREIALRFARARELLASARADERGDGLALAEHTLVFDPYDVPARTALAVAHARRGDPDAALEHLMVCFDLEAIDSEALRADPALRGALPASVFDTMLGRIEGGHLRRVRFGSPRFEGVAPDTSETAATLHWDAEHQEDVLAAFLRLAEHAARQDPEALDQYYGGDATVMLSSYIERVSSPYALDESMLGLYGYAGRVHRFFREIAPFVRDVRFFAHEPMRIWPEVDEYWIVGSAFHFRRYPFDTPCPLDALEPSERARWLDGLAEPEPDV